MKLIPDDYSEIWHVYSNAIEEKDVCNWNAFPSYISSFSATKVVLLFQSEVNWFSIQKYFSVNGSNGGGWHIHPSGGKLNMHLDYSIHPKLALQRKINIIVYLNSGWENS